jgi:hypothetical protein
MAKNPEDNTDLYGARYALALSRVLDVVANLESLVDTGLIDLFNPRTVAEQTTDSIRLVIQEALVADVTYATVLPEVAASLGYDISDL